MIATAARPAETDARLDDLARQMASMVSIALIDELHAFPKPGLVSHVDTGSHTDMDAATFQASVATLEPFFAELVVAGAANPSMGRLRTIGIAAETAMLAATGGVNTHRGAIFALGLLCAAAGAAWLAEAMPADAETLCAIVSQRWGSAIAAAPHPAGSHGAAASVRFGVGGARAEAASGFRHAREVGLPALRQARRIAPEGAEVQAFFALMARLDDTNLLHRGGEAGLRYAQAQATAFLARGGVARPDWRDRALAIHRAFVVRDLSPGGAADCLAVTLFLDALGAGA